MANCIRCGRQLPSFSFRKICQWCVQHEAAQRGEGNDYQPVITQPWVRRSESSITLTQILFGACIAVYLAMAIANGSPMEMSGQIMLHFGANYGPDTLSGQWWRLVTYMFLHAGIWHILFNMWCLWDLGRLCESLYGRWTYAGLYFITGIAGGLTSIGWNPVVLSVGASGAVFGLAGALIASFYLGEFSLPRLAISGTLRSLVIFAVFNIVIGQFFGGVDNACHIGGLVSGLILGALIARLAPRVDNPVRRTTIVATVALFVLLAGLGVRQWRGGPMRLARVYQDLQEKGDTIGRFQMIVRLKPNSVPAHFGLAAAYFEKQQFPQAEAEYKKVLELQPGYTPAKFQLGLTYLNERRYPEARAAFNDMVAQEDTKAQGHYGLGLVLEDEGKYQSAIDEFQAALKAQPSMSDVNQELGNSYLKLGRFDDAIAALLKEKEVSADNAELENALADAYQAKGMAKEAQAARDRAQELRGQAH
jgi:membrane associated rhomboid family serine protease/Tfp pilus assembly protein PilF